MTSDNYYNSLKHRISTFARGGGDVALSSYNRNHSNTEHLDNKEKENYDNPAAANEIYYITKPKFDCSDFSTNLVEFSSDVNV